MNGVFTNSFDKLMVLNETYKYIILLRILNECYVHRFIVYSLRALLRCKLLEKKLKLFLC